MNRVVTGGRAVTLAAALAFAGCTAPERTAAPGTPAQACTALFAELDRRVERQGVRDAQAAPLAGFPYLRVDRLLASWRTPPPAGAAFDAWTGAMRALDARARAFEIANLPATALAGEERANLLQRTERCAAQLLAADRDSGRLQLLLPERATVPNAYLELPRVLGLYPVAQLALRQGVLALHARQAAVFATPLEALPAAGERVAFAPPHSAFMPAVETARLIEASRDPLGVPRPAETARARLLAQFAPVLVVDVAGDADRIGAPRLAANGPPAVDVGQPVAYTLLSHARLGGVVLLQLNYVFWFPARPAEGVFDLLAGHLDGLTVRVTLARDGEPLLYETMHNCGCYHMFFPTERLERTVPDGPAEEPLWIPQPAPALQPGERLAIYLASGNHYVQRLIATPRPETAVSYGFADYDVLRSLPHPMGGRRSLFGPDGIVPGTARAERWLLWPSGVPSPGAMRQWGHHATAFVGRRHFDDPDLIARWFALSP